MLKFWLMRMREIKKICCFITVPIYSENMPLMLQNSKPVQKRGIAGEKCGFFRHSLADTKG